MAFNVFGFLIGGALADREGIVDPASRNRVALVGGLLGSSTTGLLVTTLLVRREAEAIPPTSTTTGGLLVAVPDVTGSKVGEAQKAILTDGKLKVQVQEVVSDQDNRQVIAEEPAPHTLVVEGSTVTLFVSKVEPQRITVPDVTKLPVAEAREKLQDENFKVLISDKTDSSPDIRKGCVVKTEPPAGTSVDPESEVTVFVSSGSA